MAGKKISELQALTEITGQEMIPVARDGQNYSVLSSLLQSGDATKLNDYMYDVSELMGKMAVRGTKGTSKTTKPFGSGYYHVDGSYTELGSMPNVITVIVDENKVYHFDIGYYKYTNIADDAAVLVLFDENNKVLTAVPWAEGGFLDKYLVFTSEVKKYGVTYTLDPTVKPQPPIYNKTYEIEDVNDALSDLSEKSNSMRDDFNNYISDVTNLFGKMVYRDGIGTDLANPIVGGYIRLSDGVLVQTDDSYSYQYVDVDSTKCYRLQNLISGAAVSMLALYNKDGALIKSYRSKIDGYFVFKGVSKIGLSGTTSSIQQIFTIQSFGISDINTVINTRQGNRALYVAAGAVYNEQTGFYELNGLTDITEEQMREIYNQTNHVTRQTDLLGVFVNTNNIRTNYPFKIDGRYKPVPCYAAFVRCTNIEVVAFTKSTDGVFYPSRVIYLFQYCRKLKEVIGIIRMDYVDSSEKYNNMFYQCTSLVRVSLRGVKYDISFSDSPLISLESLQFLITNAANTSPITVTVHADVYAKIQDETNVEWHALIETAAAKRITFATA